MAKYLEFDGRAVRKVKFKEKFQFFPLEDLFPKLVHFGKVLSSAKIFKCFLPQKKGSPLTLCAKRSSKSVYVLRTE